MPRAKWLTPEPPGDGFICRRLNVPNSPEFIALVTGALLSLQEQYNWEPFGSLTPAETCGLFQEMVDEFALPGERTCRMVGEVILYAGTDYIYEPWFPCDGRSLEVASYPALFAAIGYTYGQPDAEHFNIPDLRGKVPIGVGTGDGLTPRAIGDTGGEEEHELSIAELAAHTHTDSGHSHTEGTATDGLINGGLEAPAVAAFASAGVTGTGAASLSTDGDDFPHNNMQPFLALLYYIVHS